MSFELDDDDDAWQDQLGSVFSASKVDDVFAASNTGQHLYDASLDNFPDDILKSSPFPASTEEASLAHDQARFLL
jgi:hypothetical protein